MSFKDNVNLHVDKSAKLLNFSDDLLEHLKSTHSLIKVFLNHLMACLVKFFKSPIIIRPRC